MSAKTPTGKERTIRIIVFPIIVLIIALIMQKITKKDESPKKQIIAPYITTPKQKPVVVPATISAPKNEESIDDNQANNNQ